MDDNQIIELYMERNEQAIEETSSKYGGFCFRIAYNILANREDSDEKATVRKAVDSLEQQCRKMKEQLLKSKQR